MADVRAQIDLRELQTKLAKLGQAIEDFRPAWPIVDKYTTIVLKRQFDSEGAFLLGRKWKGWSPAWARRRPRPGGNRGGILRDTNRLWASFTKSGAPEGITDMSSKRQYRRGSAVAYAAPVHALRPIFPERLPDTVVNVYGKIIADRLERST